MVQTAFGMASHTSPDVPDRHTQGDVWTIKSMLDWTRAYLERKGDEHPRRSAEWLLCSATGLSRIELYTNFDRPLDTQELAKMHDGVIRRGRGEPLQYVTGEMPFRHIVLKCAPGVLIPRPETEILVDEVLAYVDKIPVPQPSEDQDRSAGKTCDVHVLEVGVGTGCITLSLCSEQDRIDACATDISSDAIALATRNRDALGLTDRVQLFETDLAANVPGSNSNAFDVLVSNPPYIPTPILATLPHEVTGFEPRLALDGGQDGLDVFRRLVKLGCYALRPGGLFACELHEDCLVMASELPQLKEAYENIRIVKDLTGRNRHLIAQLKPEACLSAKPPADASTKAEITAQTTAEPTAQTTAENAGAQQAQTSEKRPSSQSNVVTMSWDHPESQIVERAAGVLASGGVVALPTDTVYGIAQAVDPNPQGAQRLFAIKQRDLRKPIAWLVAGPDALDEYGVDVPQYAYRLARAFWPGGLTLVVRASQKVPAVYRGSGQTIALRVPAAPVVIELAKRICCPLATTSANTSGLPAPASFAQLEPRIRQEADLVLDDGITHSLDASTVVVCTDQTPLVTRIGTLSTAMIMSEALGE